MVRVKICGVTNWADAKLAIDAGADALGFNFYPPSPRAVAPAQAWGIIRRLPPFVEAVGVFVNWSSDAVTAMARAVRLASVQLHGDESPRTVAECAATHPVIKAFGVDDGFRPAALARYRRAAAFLLDGFSERLRGGTGRRFDGRYVPETLVAPLEELESAYAEARADKDFQTVLESMLRDFAGRPTPLQFAARLTEHLGGPRIYLKREDLLHTGAHKINNCIGQGLLAARMGKRRVIAETGAGQHGVATATVAARLGPRAVPESRGPVARFSLRLRGRGLEFDRPVL